MFTNSSTVHAPPAIVLNVYLITDFLENVDKTARSLSEVPGASPEEEAEGSEPKPEATSDQNPPEPVQVPQSTPQKLTVSRGREGKKKKKSWS